MAAAIVQNVVRGRPYRRADPGLQIRVSHALGLELAKPPFVSTGARALLHLIESFPSASIKLFGFTHEGWPGHPWDAERRWVDSLRQVERMPSRSKTAIRIARSLDGLDQVKARRRAGLAADAQMRAQNIIITGAGGVIGSRLVPHFRAQGRNVTTVDMEQAPQVDVVADLSKPGDWARTFAGAQAMIHLAARANPNIDQALADENVRITRNVVAACCDQAVERIIFASSLWTMEGYFGRRTAVEEAMPPAAYRPYAVSKLISEQDVAGFPGASLSLRLGAVLADNRPSVIERFFLDKWLSDRDLCRAFGRALDAEVSAPLILNITSANARSPWSLKRSRAAIGYVPIDGISHRRLLLDRVRRRHA